MIIRFTSRTEASLEDSDVGFRVAQLIAALQKEDPQSVVRIAYLVEEKGGGLKVGVSSEAVAVGIGSDGVIYIERA